MIRSLLVASSLVLLFAGCKCGLAPVNDCNGKPCTDGGSGGGGGGSAVGGGDGAGGGAGVGGGEGGGMGVGGGGETDGGVGGGAAGGVGGGSGVGGGTGGSGGTGGTGGTGGGLGLDGGVNPSTVCLDAAKRKCDFYIRCRTDVNDAQGRGNAAVAAGERGKCEALFANDRACTIGAAGWASGRATVDLTKYGACLDATYPSNSCSRDLNDASKKCATTAFVTAATAVGGNCTSDSECVNGWCSIANNALCGTCQAQFNADGGVANCDRDSQCVASRSYCLGADGQMANQPCQAFTAIDAGCIFVSPNQEQCGPGNVCASTAAFGQNPKCLPGKLEAASCIKGRQECLRSGRGKFELTCATDVQGFDTCQKQYNTVAGGRCGTGETVPSSNASEGTFCLETEFCATGVCANRRAAAAPCTATDQCQAGLRCNGTVCVPFTDVDGGCSNSFFCKNMLNCNPATNACEPGFSLDGGACSGGQNGTLCAEGFCGQGAVTTCSPLLANGQPCNQFSQCQSYACVGNVCAMACWKP